MGRHEPESDYLCERALTKGYKLGAHRAEDSKNNTETYIPKTLKDQNGALKRYEKYINSGPSGLRPCIVANLVV